MKEETRMARTVKMTKAARTTKAPSDFYSSFVLSHCKEICKRIIANVAKKYSHTSLQTLENICASLFQSIADGQSPWSETKIDEFITIAKIPLIKKEIINVNS